MNQSIFMIGLLLCFSIRVQGETGATSPSTPASTANITATTDTTAEQTAPLSKIYSMSKEELSQLPPAVVQMEIARIQNQLQLQEKNAKYYKILNQKYCEELSHLEKNCPAFSYITEDYGLDNLNCGEASKVKKEVVVRLVNPGAVTDYYLVADDRYKTGMIVSGQPVSFSEKGSTTQLKNPPRFIDLTTLKIKAVKKDSPNVPVPIPGNLEVSIEIGNPLFAKSKLQYIDDGETALINPSELLELRKTPGCFADAARLTKIQKDAQQQSSQP